MKVVVVRKKVKTLTIRVEDENTVRVSVPIDIDNQSIEKILALKSNWIEKKIIQIKDLKNKNKDIFDNKKVLLYGNNYDIAYADVPNICCVENFIILPKSKEISCDETQKAISNYLLSLAKDILPKYVSMWGEKMSLCPTGIKIKKLKSKWGSCNGDGLIVLNARLIQLPVRLLEYVVVHELCHLKNLNHSESFWQSVKKYFPDLDDVRKELRKYDLIVNGT